MLKIKIESNYRKTKKTKNAECIMCTDDCKTCETCQNSVFMKIGQIAGVGNPLEYKKDPEWRCKKFGLENSIKYAVEKIEVIYVKNKN